MISIHAPTRGATVTLFGFWWLNIFQSTLPREERQLDMLIKARNRYFNPRSHERSDQIFQNEMEAGKNFNPRSHERSDDFCIMHNDCHFIFQSTLPREERHKPPYPITRHDTFQSTLPREERPRTYFIGT